MSGIWAADISKLSTRSGLPALWELEQKFGGIIKGAFKKAFHSKKPRFKRRLLSFPNGLGALITALSAKLPSDSIICNSVVTAITEGVEDITINYIIGDNSVSITAKHLLITLPTDQTSQLLKTIDLKYSELIAKVPYSPVGIIHLAIKDGSGKVPIKGFGFLCPPESGKFLMGAIFSSAIFPFRAPVGWHLLTCFVGGGVNPEGANVKNDEIRESIIKEIEGILQLSEKPKILANTYIQRAIPCYPVRHFELEVETREFEKNHPRIKINTNWLNGISLPDRIAKVNA